MRVSEGVMSERQTLWVEEMCRSLAEIERKTLEKLGEEKGGFFIQVGNDWLKINSAVMDAYSGERGYNLVLHTFGGLFKEVYWFHFFFVTGNYPLLLSRLRFVWESVFRAYFAEHFPLGPHRSWAAPGPSPDDKVAWLKEHEGPCLNWDGCIEPVLRIVFPLADREKEVRDFYKAEWNELHKYVHPSAYLADKMIGESALHVTDNFDKKWALEAVGVATKVFDLVWLAILRHHPVAFEKVERLCGAYPILKIVFEDEDESR
jgi:hypothetical protein